MIKVILLLMLLSMTAVCWGFEMSEPRDGAVYHPGETVAVKVIPDLNEDIISVLFEVSKLETGTVDLHPPYEFTFTIDPEFVGSDLIRVNAKLSNDNFVEKKINIKVVLLPYVKIESISVDPKKIYLFKLPSNLSSDAAKVNAYEIEYLGVGGIYSDGIMREITASESGTSYMSSNESVVSVDSEGKVRAHGLGTARITIRNGSFSKDIDVVVKPYK